MNKYLKNWIALFITASAAHAAMANQEAMPQQCAVKSRSSAVVIVQCAPQLEQTVWRQAGRAACESKQQCNAWIWDDTAKIPAKAPLKDAEMPKDQAAAAVAIWLNDSQSLMTIKSNSNRK